MRIKQAELVAMLRQIADLIVAGDSMEGSLEYSWTGPNEYEVVGAYRFGNANGQGSMRLIEPSGDKS